MKKRTNSDFKWLLFGVIIIIVASAWFDLNRPKQNVIETMATMPIKQVSMEDFTYNSNLLFAINRFTWFDNKTKELNPSNLCKPYDITIDNEVVEINPRFERIRIICNSFENGIYLQRAGFFVDIIEQSQERRFICMYQNGDSFDILTNTIETDYMNSEYVKVHNMYVEKKGQLRWMIISCVGDTSWTPRIEFILRDITFTRLDYRYKELIG